MSQMSASELAAALNVTKARVSQYVSEGKLAGCYTGDGRQRRFDLIACAKALGRTLDKGQMMGNGAETRKALSSLSAQVEQVAVKEPVRVELRKLFWVMLKEHHPEVTEREAGKLVQSATAALNSVMTSAMPDAAVMDAIGLQAEPEKAKATPNRVA